MEKINLNEYLASNEYPGRGIAAVSYTHLSWSDARRDDRINKQKAAAHFVRQPFCIRKISVKRE